MKPKVSVIVPVYNVEKYLSKCLKSLCEQTLKDIEIICINDGSTDNSPNILESFAKNDDRIKIYNQTNQGLSAARNNAMEHASGEFISFVDSDDWVDTDFFEKLYNAAVENNCDIACAGFKRCGRIIKSKRNHYDRIQLCKDIDSKIYELGIPEYNYVWGKIYKREKLPTKLFHIGRYYEDIPILIKIIYDLGDLVAVPDTYYYYRKNYSSIVFSKSTKHNDDLKWAFGELHRFADEHNIKLPNYRNYSKREYVNLFGITILKIYHKENIIEYKLFGFIPFLTIRICEQH